MMKEMLTPDKQDALQILLKLISPNCGHGSETMTHLAITLRKPRYNQNRVHTSIMPYWNQYHIVTGEKQVH